MVDLLAEEQARKAEAERRRREKPLLEQSYFSGGDATPRKLRDLANDMYLRCNDPSALALLSGCAIAFLLEFARSLEAEEQSFDAIKVGRN